jgi:DNA-binding NarL/FixJ family response regulator
VERTIRVLIADDHAVYRWGLRTLLDSEPDMEVVGEAATGKEVIERAAEIRPDAILMDIQMPGINGIAATSRIIEANQQIGVVILTMHEDDDSVFSAMRAGARGYVLMNFFAAPKVTSPADVFPELSSREIEILDLIARGHSNAKIAARLFVSPKTVANHLSHIFTKLQVADRAHAMIRAREAGLGREDS